MVRNARMTVIRHADNRVLCSGSAAHRPTFPPALHGPFGVGGADWANADGTTSRGPATHIFLPVA